MKKIMNILLTCILINMHIINIHATSKINIKNCTFTLTEDRYTYTGYKIKPKLYIEDEDFNMLEEGEDYSLTYKSNKNAGTGKIVVKGKGEYTGNKTVSFTICKKSIKDCKMSLSNTSYSYDGKNKKPTVTITFNKSKLTSSNYTVSYSSNCNVGKAKVTIQGINNFNDKKSLSFIILPPIVSNVSLLYTNNKIKVTYDKIAKVTGYEIMMNNDTKKLTTNTASYFFKPTTSYNEIKVRAYKVIDSKTYYGSFSKIKTISI